MSLMKSGTLRVPGANLYYEVNGNGPILLLIHGAVGGAQSFNGITKHLADQYTVVSYDRRGFSRSTIDDPEEVLRVETHSDDAHCLLKELGVDVVPASVLSSSGGAMIGIDLATRYPNQVRMLVAHEPPSGLSSLTPELRNAIMEIARREGANVAMQRFIAMIGITYDDREPEAEIPTRAEQQFDESALHTLESELAMCEHYALDCAALRVALAQTRIVMAVGQIGHERPVYQNTVAIADRFDLAVAEFPGHHMGYVNYPRAFAAKLRDVLDS